MPRYTNKLNRSTRSSLAKRAAEKASVAEGRARRTTAGKRAKSPSPEPVVKKKKAKKAPPAPKKQSKTTNTSVRGNRQLPMAKKAAKKVQKTVE